MSAPAQVDYDALAKANGATSSQAPVDYDALAKQHGAITSQTAAPLNQPILSGYKQAGEGLINVAKGFGKGALETVVGAGRMLQKIPSGLDPVGISDVARAVPESVMKKGEELATSGGTTGEFIGGLTENVAEFAAGEEALTGLGKLVKLSAKAPRLLELVEKYPTIAKMITMGAVQEGVKSGGDPVKAAEGAGGAAVGGLLGEGAGKVVQKLGKVLEEHAPDFMNSVLRANKPKNYLYGKNPGMAIIDEKLNVPKSPTLVGQLEDLHGQLEGAGNKIDSEIKQTLSQPAIAAQKQDVVPIIKNAIQDAKNDILSQRGADVPEYLKELKRLEKNLLTKYDPSGKALAKLTREELSPAEISDLKKSIGKTTQWNISPLDPQMQLKGFMNSVRKQIYGELADTVEKFAPEVGELNGRFANVIEAQGLLEKRIAMEHGTGGLAKAARKGEWAWGLKEILTGHPYLGLPFIANRIARGVPGSIALAKGEMAAGKGITAAAEAIPESVKSLATAGAAVTGEKLASSQSEQPPE